MSVCLFCGCVFRHSQGQKYSISPIWSYRHVWAAQSGCWLNSGPLQDQYVLLTAELFSRPKRRIFFILIVRIKKQFLFSFHIFPWLVPFFFLCFSSPPPFVTSLGHLSFWFPLCNIQNYSSSIINNSLHFFIHLSIFFVIAIHHDFLQLPVVSLTPIHTKSCSPYY